MNGLNENIVKTALIVASFVIAGILGLLVNPAWLMLLVVPLFGIPLLRELRVLKDADERETWDHYRGSHLAFYAIMIYTVVSIIIGWLNGWPAPYQFYAILFIGFIVKLLFGVATVLDQRLAAVLLMGLYGTIWLFISIPSGIGMPEILEHSAGGIAVMLLAGLGYFYPLTCGALLALVSIVFVFYPLNLFLAPTSIEAHISLLSILVVPPLVSGWMLINSHLRQRREASIKEVAS